MKKFLALFFCFIIFGISYNIIDKEINQKMDALRNRVVVAEERTKELENRNLGLTEKLEELQSEPPYIDVLRPIGMPTACNEVEILAKLLYCEAGNMTWEGQVYTCSAILNLSDEINKSINTMAHEVSLFSVASYVDNAEPTEMQYEVIDYVLKGGRIPEICYFRTDYYHNFGTPVCQVGAHYFSKP